MTMTLDDRIKDAEATKEFLKSFMDDLATVRESARIYCDKVSKEQFPGIWYTAFQMDKDLESACIKACSIASENIELLRQAKLELAESKDIAHKAASDRRAAILEQIKNKLESVDFESEARIVVRMEVFEDTEDRPYY